MIPVTSSVEGDKSDVWQDTQSLARGAGVLAELTFQDRSSAAMTGFEINILKFALLDS